MFATPSPKRPCLSALIVMLPCMAAGGQTNLLVNGGFETNNGFVPRVTGFEGYTFAPVGGDTFAGFTGFDTDLQDDGFVNGTFTGTTAGGGQFSNVFPAAADAQQLLGGGSGLILGGFFGGSPNFSGIFQQAAIAGGDQVTAAIYALSDPTILNGQGQPDTIFSTGQNNRVFAVLEFFDGINGSPIPGSDVAIDLLNPQTQVASQVEGRWVEGFLTATAPANAQFARVGLFFEQRFNTGTFQLGGGLAFFDQAALVNTSAGSPLAGDFDFTGGYTAADIDLLTRTTRGEILTASTRWDLDNSGGVSGADRLFLIQTLIGTDLGDVNLDGLVDAADEAVVQANLGTSDAGWADGDLTGDGLVDANDLAFFLVGLGGDYNNNGQVEQGDLDLVLLNWGQDGSTPPSGWVNDLPSGLIDQAELDGVLLNWGDSSEPLALPEPASTACLLTALGLALRNRKPA